MPNTLALAQVTQRLNRARLGNILATRDTNLPEPSDRPPIANPVFSFYDGYNPHLMSDTNLWDLHIVARNQNVVIRGFESTLPREQSRESQVEVEQPSEGDMEDRFESGHSQPREEENDENDENNPSSIYEDALSHFSSYSSFFSLRYTSCSHSLSTLGRELGMNSFDRDEVSGEEQSDSFIPSMAESASISSYPSSYGPLSPFSQLDIGTPLAHSTPHLLSSFAHDSKSDAADIDHSLEIELWSQDIFYVDGTPDIDMIPGDELSDSVAGSPSPSSHSSFSPIRQRDVDSPPLVHSPPFSLVDYIRTSRTEREAINHLLDHEIWVRDVLGFDEESDEEDLVEGSTSPSPTGRHDNDPPSLAHQTPFSLVDYIRTSESEMDDVNQLLEHEIWIRDVLGYDETTDGDDILNSAAGSTSASPSASNSPLTQTTIDSPPLSHSTTNSLYRYVHALDHHMHALGASRAQELWYGCCQSHRETGRPGLGIQIGDEPMFPISVVGLGFMVDGESLFDGGSQHFRSY